MKAGAETTAAGAPEPGQGAFTTLQGLIWPEQGICTERELYVRLKGPAGLSQSRREIRFAAGGKARFDTWFNLFNAGKWRRHCALESLHLALTGEGVFEVTVMRAEPRRSWEQLVTEVVTLTGGPDPLRLDLTHALLGAEDESVLFCELRALGDGILHEAAWQSADPPRRRPDLVVAITTFRREAEVANTVARFADWAAQTPLSDDIRLVVVDNGRTVEIDPALPVTVIGNENLGGAGGFSRGLLAARDRGASHCLFMDDDASLHMGSLDRAWRFLAYASNPAAAVAGAMINARHRWSIWENGAVFNARCRPLYMGTDLREEDEVLEMEFATTGPVPDNFYGGWWFFAFPVDHADHMPFPFFVRGDDVSFSLVHDFDTVTLNGVVSFQESFTDKESPQTWYLDLRSHMAHHLALPHMEVGRLRCLKIAVWFFARNLPRMHYETLAAINLALEDVMRGPDFFDENADMAQRRADIGALTDHERWRGIPPDMALDPMRNGPAPRWKRLLAKFSLNGHLVPFFRVLGDRITLPAKYRGLVGYTWGAARLTYLSADRRRYYTVTHSKRAFARQSWRFIRNAARFLTGYDGLRDDWREGYGRLTRETYWRRKLGAERSDTQPPGG